MPAGDSITVFYRPELWNMVGRTNHVVNFVGAAHPGANPPDDDCEAYAGAVINTVRTNVTASIVAQNPRVILWHCGTNDTATETSASVIIARHEAAIREWHGLLPSAKIYWGTQLGHTLDSTRNSTMLAVNAAMPSSIATLQGEGIDISIVDFYGKVSLSGDGMHPDANGYLSMAGIWFGKLIGDL